MGNGEIEMQRAIITESMKFSAIVLKDRIDNMVGKEGQNFVSPSQWIGEVGKQHVAKQLRSKFVVSSRTFVGRVDAGIICKRLRKDKGIENPANFVNIRTRTSINTEDQDYVLHPSKHIKGNYVVFCYVDKDETTINIYGYIKAEDITKFPVLEPDGEHIVYSCYKIPKSALIPFEDLAEKIEYKLNGLKKWIQ